MIQTVNKYEFSLAFRACDRHHAWTIAGLDRLFAHIEETDPGYSLDVIDLDGRWAQYADLEDLHETYDSDDYPTVEAFQDATTVLETADGSLIIEEF